MRTLVSLVLSIAIGFSALVVLAWIAQRSLIYFPARDTPAPADYGLGR
jgi:hypothetical protein